MSTELMNKSEVTCSVTRFAPDFKRILRVQFKEFIHTLDEAPLFNISEPNAMVVDLHHEHGSSPSSLAA